MSSKGGHAVPPPPQRQGGDRFYNAPAIRRHQEILLQQQQQQQQMLQRQVLRQQQQHQHQHHLQQQKQQQQLFQRKREALMPESSSAAAAKAGTETRKKEAEVSSKAADAVALPAPPAVARDPNLNATNLDRLMEAVTPFIQARCLPEVNARGRKAGKLESLPFFNLEDLWDFFSEWSYYGAGVPLLLNGEHPTEQYYVPFLSGIQVYIDPSNPSSRIRGGPNVDITAESYRLRSGASSRYPEGGDRRSKSMLGSNMQRLNNLSLGDKSVTSSQVVAHSRGQPSFQFLEFDPPYNRRPLADKISELVSQNPELNKYRSCDLLPSSWICVAWYPIYRIPIGPTLKDLDASFLTFHSLSTQPRSHCPSQFHAPNTRTVRGNPDPTAKISLPVFALAAYKLKGSIVSPIGPHEWEQENSLLQAADKWLTGLDVMLPDYNFFRNNRR